MRKVLRGLGALILMAVLLVGIPWGLWQVAGNPLPSSVPDADALLSRLLRPDVTGEVVLTVVQYAGWIAWATFAVAILIELPARLRGVPAPRMPGLGMQQRLAGSLVAAVVAMLTIAPVLSAAPASAAPAPHEVAAPASVSLSVAAPADDAAAPASTASADVGAAQDAAAGTPDQAATFDYTVKQGDSLWRIAERFLGAGDRYPEIAQLNYGAPQPGGYTLDASHWIDPGWTLRVPGADPAAPAAAADAVAGHLTYVIQPGDTLWEVAEQHLGDGGRFAEIVEASRDLVQPGGAHLVDPGLVRPGWTVLIPMPAPAAPQPAVTAPAEAAPAPAASQAPAGTPATIAELGPTPASGGMPSLAALAAPAPTAAASTATATASRADDAQDRVGPDTIQLATVAGLGGLAAVGLLAALAARRRRADRHRKPGERVAPPAPGSAPARLEQELRAVADPIGVDQADAALRALSAWHLERRAALPPVRAARILPERIELYLETPADLPAPWRDAAERAVWTIERESLPAAPEATTASAPYPALVTIGQDDEGAHLLVDLEQVGVLGVQGDGDAVAAALAGIVVELAAGPWADDLQVTCVGLLHDLEPTLGSGRVRHAAALADVIDDVERRAAAVTAQLAALGAGGVRTARGHGRAVGVCTPEVIVVAAAPTPAEARRLTRLTSAGAPVAVVVAVEDAQSTPWTLQVGPVAQRRACLHPMGIDIAPQLLDEETYRTLLALLDPHAVAIVPGPAWARGLELREPPELDELTRVRPVGAPTPAASVTPDAAAPSLRTGPVVRLLGPVDVERCRGVEPAAHQRARAAEVGAFLALHPDGVGVPALAAAVWPARRVGQQAWATTTLSRVRRWWGAGPDGAEHVVVTRDDDAGEVYRAVNVSTDWDRFCELVGPRAVDAPTSQLMAALDLVRGAPFGETRGYAWSEPFAAEMRAAVIDIAHEVVGRAFEDGRADLAQVASAVAREVDPGDDRGWSDGLRAAWAGGDVAAVRHLADGYHLVTSTSGIEPDPTTEELIDELIGRVAA